MSLRKLGSQGIGFFSPESKRSIKERRHYSPSRLKSGVSAETICLAEQSDPMSHEAERLVRAIV
jgi:hypothetical protein